jgi:hypothetical protein
MAEAFFAGLRSGAIRRPDALINGMGPLPFIPPGAPQFSTPDGRINAQTVNFSPTEALGQPYAYGTSARISTQTQQAHPNRVQLVIPKLRVPSPESDGLDETDPVLQHAVSDGDLIFTFRMGTHMMGYGAQYVHAPYGFAAKATPVVNLACVNYILWGLQVGLNGPKGKRWKAFFAMMTKHAIHRERGFNEAEVWRFIQAYLRPFAIQHGGDQQGGMHEGDPNSVVTHGAVDYVASMMIEGKARHVNNLWTGYDVHENDDLILALRFKAPPHGEVPFVLSSSVRATRNERVAVGQGFYYLRPEILAYRSFSDTPYIHIGRSQKYCSAFQRSMDSCAFDARAPVSPGAPLQITFEPTFVDSDAMFYRKRELVGDYADEDDDDDADRHPRRRGAAGSAVREADGGDAPVAEAPRAHLLPPPPRADAAAAPARRQIPAPSSAEEEAGGEEPAASTVPVRPPKAKKPRATPAGASSGTTAATGSSGGMFSLLTGGGGRVAAEDAE